MLGCAGAAIALNMAAVLLLHWHHARWAPLCCSAGRSWRVAKARLWQQYPGVQKKGWRVSGGSAQR